MDRLLPIKTFMKAQNGFPSAPHPPILGVDWYNTSPLFTFAKDRQFENWVTNDQSSEYIKTFSHDELAQFADILSNADLDLHNA
jgi:hypothetical protein